MRSVTVSSDALLQGILTEDRFAMHCALTSVGQVMTPDPITVDIARTVAEARALFARERYRNLLVMESSHLAGVVSDRAVLEALLAHDGAQHRPVTTIMTRAPVTVAPDATLSTAVHLLLAHRVDCLPVTMPGGTVCGILTASDLLSTLFPLQRWMETRAPRLQA